MLHNTIKLNIMLRLKQILLSKKKLILLVIIIALVVAIFGIFSKLSTNSDSSLLNSPIVLVDNGKTAGVQTDIYSNIKTKNQYIKLYSSFAVDEMNNLHWLAKSNDIVFHYPASVKLAQALYETGYYIDKPSKLTHRQINNHFGIKSTSENDSYVIHADDTENDRFRVYETPWFSYRDHTAFMFDRIYNPTNSKEIKYTKYKQLRNLTVLTNDRKSNYIKWCEALNDSPYATKRKYGDAIKRIIETEELYNLDLKFKPNNVPSSSNNIYFFKKKEHTLKKNEIVVYLDAGHGFQSNTIFFYGLDTTMVNGKVKIDTVLVNSFSESDFNRDIVIRIAKMLDAKKIKYQFVVDPDYHKKSDVKLHERTLVINNQPEDKILVSIHANANSINRNGIGQPTTAQGSEIYLFSGRYSKDNTSSRYYFLESVKLANNIYDYIEYRIPYVTHRKGHNGNKFKVRRLWMVTAPHCPAILVEADFYTNVERMIDMKTESYKNNFAKAIADGIERYINQLK